jgi:signal transduction histidine kinase/DNA-binding response OmpR family regulator/HPt (histidine-containing phosphotransfer) domain-containing protein
LSDRDVPGSESPASVKRHRRSAWRAAGVFVRRWGIRRRLHGLILLCGIAFAALFAVLIVRLDHTSRLLGEVLVDIRRQDQARVMQVEFKKQVQEWKNVLLRGHEPADLDKYRASFFEREDAVRTIGEELRDSAPDASLRELVAGFLKDHRLMGLKYREAMETFVADQARDPRAADRAVRGQDRKPTDSIDEIVARIGLAAHVQTEASGFRRERVVILVAMAGILAAMLAVGGLVASGITQPIDETVIALEQVARGEMGYRIGIVGDDEVTRMNRALNVTVDAIQASNERLREGLATAEAATRAKSEFLANMSHEIRTPMNGIIGMTDLTLDTALTEEQRSYLGDVKSSADSLLTIINDILDFSKIEAGKYEFESIDFSPRDCLVDAARTLSARADAKGLELVCDIAADVPDVLVGDPGRLRQVILNLVGNAIKFTERGEVVLSAQVLDRTPETVRLRLAVTDTGVGIPRGKLSKIFEPFTQADGSTTRLYGGTGLGLTISSHLVERMGGTITVESEVGAGSVFRFDARFPIGRELSSVSKPTPPPSLHNLRVLVVDDNATNRRILDGTLRYWAMRAIAVGSGAEGLDAVAAASADPFRLILLDSQMPGMDGFTFAEQLAARAPSPMPAILMLSSSGRRGDGTRCRERGIGGYLLKPVKRGELLEAIVSLLSGTDLETRRPETVTGHSVRVGRTSLRILLVEDNLVNQRLALRLLEKEGHRVVVAIDGRKAVDAWAAADAADPFDIVLMDVQMPGMDGFQATAAIRATERTTGRHVEIVAMTAHAMQGDRERCISEGMDAYLPKPLVLDDLRELLARRASGVLSTGVPGAARPGDYATTDWDPAIALHLMAGDREILRELAAAMIETAPGALAQCREAVAAGDSAAVARAAHGLKGAVGCVGAAGALAAAGRLEESGLDADLPEAAERLVIVEREMAALLPALRSLLESS